MYVDVILPLPLSGTFTYSIPSELENKIVRGRRVIVPFGKRKYYTAIITQIREDKPAHFAIRDIFSVLDNKSVVTEHQLSLWRWISDYYLCAPGDVIKAALPSPLLPSDLRAGFAPKYEKQLRVNTSLSETGISEIIGKAKKQQLLYDEILKCRQGKNNIISIKEVKSMGYYSQSVLNGLIEKKILIPVNIEISRLPNSTYPVRQSFPLSDKQQETLNNILNLFPLKDTVLLHGATSSGKTEIYIHLIETVITKGQQVLYLLPEIALTTQVTDRLQEVFGNRIGIYHSGIGEQERAEIWLKMLSESPYDIILGVRSSLFLPFKKLGLVIVDEEQEMSYKQQDPAPRYHARDTAIMLAHFSGAKTLLGSATPSIESYFNAKSGKYGLVTLSERFGNISHPLILLENTKELRKRKKMRTVLAPDLIDEINIALTENEQVILFRNRRGYAPIIECPSCAWTPKCAHCDVTLTYHKQNNRLICHYCNRTYTVPSECPVCHQHELKSLGAGTERLEEEVAQLFPHAKVARMDTDTTQSKDAFKRIILDFQDNKIQILIGTQMLSKGLDFGNVRVVGIISADSLLSYPDFRSNERGFQLIMQAAGRAGRRNKQGKVIIQTADPDQPVFQYILNNDYENFFFSEISERKLFRYPPFTRLISIIFKHKNEQIVDNGAQWFTNNLQKELGSRVLGPNKPLVSRIQRYYIREILIKIDHTLSPHQVKMVVRLIENEFKEKTDFKQIHLYYDVDKL